MNGILAVCLALFSCSIISVVHGENSLARGFNDNINWLTLDDGEKQSKEKNQPLMLVIHKSWCGACKALKPQFAASKEIEELSKEFVMVNVVDDEEPADPKFSPDGGYIPRILFLDPSGNVLTDIINEGGNSKYKYFYPSPTDIVKSMRLCLEKFKSASSGTDEL